MEFTSDENIRVVWPLKEALFEHVLPEEEPIFVGDETTMLDVSMEPAEELLKRCSRHYRTSVSLEDLRRPLWQLLPELEAKRIAATGHSE